MLLHKVEMWNTLRTLYTFPTFATIQLYKPRRAHTTRSSFYLIATDVQPTSLAAQNAVETWKASWKEATFRAPESTRQDDVAAPPPGTDTEQDVRSVLEVFGSQVVQLAEQVWSVQRDALSKTSWTP